MKWPGWVVTDTRDDDHGESGDEADVEIAAEYLYAAAHEN